MIFVLAINNVGMVTVVTQSYNNKLWKILRSCRPELPMDEPPLDFGTVLIYLSRYLDQETAK